MYRVATPPTVLVVDDEPFNLLVVEASLTPQGYRVRTARSAAEAERLMADVRPSLILLDVLMPAESGIDACRRWRSARLCDDVPIVLLTALGAGGHRAAGLTAGADDYLEKPFDVENLERVTRRWVATQRRTGRLPDADDADGRELALAMERAARPRRSRTLGSRN